MNRYGNRDNCIFLEFTTLVGSDAIYYPDGRHNNYSVESDIIDYARKIRNRKPSVELVGYSTKGDYSGKIYPFPEYVLNSVNGKDS